MNKSFLNEFINEYKKSPCLWRVKSEEYKNRNLKNKAYEHLLEIMKEIEPDATVKDVRNKIDSIRGTFRKELKKVKSTEGENTYIPRLWYFKKLLFLKDQETSNESSSNLDLDDALEKNFIDRSNFKRKYDTTFEEEKGYRRQEVEKVSNNRETERVFKKIDVEREDLFTIIGKNFAFKLRELPNETRLVTEKIINDVIFEAQMGNINKYTRFNLEDVRTKKGVSLSASMNAEKSDSE